MSQVLSKATIYELSDLDLVRAFRHAITETPSLLRTDWEREFAEIDIVIRNRGAKAVVVKLPFYKK